METGQGPVAYALVSRLLVTTLLVLAYGEMLCALNSWTAIFLRPTPSSTTHTAEAYALRNSECEVPLCIAVCHRGTYSLFSASWHWPRSMPQT